MSMPAAFTAFGSAAALLEFPCHPRPYGVMVDPAGKVYWTDRKAGRIQRLILECPAGVLEVGCEMFHIACVFSFCSWAFFLTAC